MAIGAETHIAAVRSYHPAISRQRTVLDERLGMAIHGMTVDELRRLREALHTLIREGKASEAQIAKTVESQSKDMVMLLRTSVGLAMTQQRWCCCWGRWRWRSPG